MKKHITKIICATVAAVVATGVAAAAGCSQYNKGVSVDYTPSDVEATSNGGFAVEKDGYIYFINGIESASANNDYGSPVKGSIMRISMDNLDQGNYNAAETLVPQIAYTTNYQTGIFIYGDYIYYGTPSVNRNSDGVVQSSNLEMKSTKLDGSESMKDAYMTFPSAAYDYRFVEVDGVVYLMYVATSETLYDETTGVNNLHSYNIKTGENTLLAYNISSYLFDAEDKTNPRVYYTMNVTNYAQGTTYNYNQVYTVTADKTEPNEYDFSEDTVLGWDDDEDRYINCGDLVFDGFGGTTDNKQPNNYAPDDEDVKNDLKLSYTLETYRHNTLFYTRTTIATSSSSSADLFYVKDADIEDKGENWNAIEENPADDQTLLPSGTSADAFKYIFDENGDLEAVLVSESGGGISINKVVDGKLSEHIDDVNYYRIVGEGTATMLFVDGDYLYYSLSGGNGYTFHRISYKGAWGDYNGLKEDESDLEHKDVQILDLDAITGWFMPELIGTHLLFAADTDDMVVYNPIMAFDLSLADTNGDSKVDNSELFALNELYNGVIGTDGKIADYSDTDDYPTDIYANLANAARYLFYTGDIEYIKELAEACNAKLEKDEDPVYSENTLNKLQEFLDVEGDWAEYAEYARSVNGEEVHANRRDYYYSVIGKMTDSDKENYIDGVRGDYLKSWPEDEPQESWFSAWYNGLAKVWQILLIIAICCVGVVVIAGITVGIIFIVRAIRSKKRPNYAKRRIKVDTTDDKDINVYEEE